MRFIKAVLVVFLMWSGSVHAGAWPTDNVVTTNLDSPTDSPSAARGDIYTALQRIKDIIGARNSASGVAPLDASSLVPLANLPNTLTGKDADSVDGVHLSGLTSSVSELNYVDVTTPGTAQASKAVVLDANKGIAGLGAVTITKADTGVKLSFSGISDASSYNYFLSAANDIGLRAVQFVNGSTASSDGGANAYVIRNAGGTLILGNASYTTQLLGSSVTINGNAAYHASGTDVAVADGGTGASTRNGARENLGIYHGAVNNAGSAFRLPSGWSSAKTATGTYTITHNLSSGTYQVLVSNTAWIHGAFEIDSQSVNSFVVKTYNSSFALADASFAFILIND